MPDEIILTPSSITQGSSSDVFNQQVELPDEVAASLGLGSKPAEQPKTEPAVEQKTEPIGDAQAAPQPTPTSDGTVKPEAKPDKVPYTEEELKVLLADPNGTLDTSRLDERGQAIHKEFQRGYTKKFEELKRERDEINRKQQEIAAFEERQRQIAEQQRFQKESEEFGEDEAKRLQHDREIESRLKQLEAERQAYQQREASEQARRLYAETAVKYHLPVEQAFEDQTVVFTYGRNLTNEKNGLPLISMEEGARDFADFIGVTNINNLEKIINANPANAEALKNKYINDYLKQTRSAGATVISSSSATVPDKPSGTENSPFDAEAYRKDPEGYMVQRLNKIFDEKNLKV